MFDLKILTDAHSNHFTKSLILTDRRTMLFHEPAKNPKTIAHRRRPTKMLPISFYFSVIGLMSSVGGLLLSTHANWKKVA